MFDTDQLSNLQEAQKLAASKFVARQTKYSQGLAIGKELIPKDQVDGAEDELNYLTGNTKKSNKFAHEAGIKLAAGGGTRRPF